MSAPTDQPLEVLKHDPVPGYPRVFWIAFFVMGLYLLVILVSSPGPAKGHGDGYEKKSHASGETTGARGLAAAPGPGVANHSSSRP